jgi:hypothetical protein
MRNYWTVTANGKQIAAAMAHPNKLLLSTSLATDDYKLA